MLTAPAGFTVTQYAGYKVVFVPVANGKPNGKAARPKIS